MRMLRVALASHTDPDAAVREIDTRIKGLRRGKGFVDWNKMAAFARDLGTLCESIEGPLAEADPAAALGLMFEVIDLAPTLIERCDDSNGRLGDIFRSACESAAALAARAAPGLPPEKSAQRAYRVYLADGYGVADDIVAAFAKALDDKGRSAMRSWIEADLGQLPPVVPDDPSARSRLPEWKLLGALAAVADAAGDVDAYCAAQQRFGPRVRDDAGMAQRLLDAGRAMEALAVLDAALPNPAKDVLALADLRIAALDALGRREDAQAGRWAEFTRFLRIEPFRDFLKRLPDFEDVVKEQEALDIATANTDPHKALEFLIAWPELQRAGALARAKCEAFDGNSYWLLTPAADAISAADPLAASLLYRRMIDFALERARASRYGHAARHLASCGWLAKTITDWQGHPPHDAYLAGLRQRHPRKAGFWSQANAG